MTELKPCPFCGGEAQLTDAFQKGWRVGCSLRNLCKVHPYVRCTGKGARKRAIEAWNNRPSPWHTGEPTEEGWYVIKTKHGSLFLVQKNSNGFWIEDKFGYERLVPTEGYIVEWQKITPYEEKENGR